METLQTKSRRQILLEAIRTVTEAFGLPLSHNQERAILTYFLTLHDWNRSINLTGIREPDMLVYKHLGDSLIFEMFMDEKTESLLDIGTGQGVPGLILKIIRPQMYVVLAEAVKKKCSFLNYVSSLLRLSELKVEEGRLEKGARPEAMPEGGFDMVVSQAAGSLNWLLDLSVQLVSERGRIASLKGPSVKGEFDALKRRAREFGLQVVVKETLLPVLNHERVMVLFERVHNKA